MVKLRRGGGSARRRPSTGALAAHQRLDRKPHHQRHAHLLRINEADGLSNGIMIYDVPNDDYAGVSMNEDGSGGYLVTGTRDIAPLDTFQLLKVDQIGGNVDCLVEYEIETEDLIVDDIIVEVVPEDVQVTPAICDLLIYSRANNVMFSSDSFLDNVLLVIIHKESVSWYG